MRMRMPRILIIDNGRRIWVLIISLVFVVGMLLFWVFKK
jgi:hypothetical protein